VEQLKRVGRSKPGRFNIEVTSPDDPRDSLIVKYQFFVERVVNSMSKAMRLPSSRRDDFISAGFVGLIEAAGRFDPELSVDFKSFAFFRIRGAIIDYIRNSCELSGRAYRAFRVFESAQIMSEQRFSTRFDRDGHSSDSDGSGGISRNARSLKAIEQLENLAVVFKLSGLFVEDESDDPGGELHSIELGLEEKKKGSRIRELVKKLPEKERTIIEQHYFHDRKFIDVASEFSGLSKSWVSRLHDRAIKMLRVMILSEIPELAA
jgi:RNA polymerase sigma factor for flagellar operon FliA